MPAAEEEFENQKFCYIRIAARSITALFKTSNDQFTVNVEFDEFKGGNVFSIAMLANVEMMNRCTYISSRRAFTSKDDNEATHE